MKRATIDFVLWTSAAGLIGYGILRDDARFVGTGLVIGAILMVIDIWRAW